MSAAIATIVMKSTEVRIFRTALNLPVACQITLEVSVVKKNRVQSGYLRACNKQMMWGLHPTHTQYPLILSPTETKTG